MHASNTAPANALMSFPCPFGHWKCIPRNTPHFAMWAVLSKDGKRGLLYTNATSDERVSRQIVASPWADRTAAGST